MEAEKANYPITVMARALGVSRAGYYKWLRRTGGDDPWEGLKEAIAEIHGKSRGRFGARKVRARLISDHHDRFGNVTLYRVRKCMRELGLEGVCPHARKQTTVPDEGAKSRPDLIGRDFASPVPTYRLVGDITYLKTLTGFIYLAVVIDLATRMVVGWSIRDDMRADLVVEALEMAYTRGYVAVGGIFHSDRGSQYTSSMFGSYAKSIGVRLSVGRTGSSYDNAVAESFFGTLKNEWFHHERTLDEETTRHLAIEFIESYYNRYRPHETIDDRVPAEVMQEFFERLARALEYDPDAILAA